MDNSDPRDTHAEDYDPIAALRACYESYSSGANRARPDEELREVMRHLQFLLTGSHSHRTDAE